MKVVDQRKPHTVSFSILNIGDIFYDVYDTESFFMRVDVSHDDINAICLHDGMGYKFDDGEYVEIVSAELVVHN